jgi:hypothetical protein
VIGGRKNLMKKCKKGSTYGAIEKEKKDISRGVSIVKHTAVAWDWVEAYRASLSFQWFKYTDGKSEGDQPLVNIPRQETANGFWIGERANHCANFGLVSLQSRACHWLKFRPGPVIGSNDKEISLILQGGL